VSVIDCVAWFYNLVHVLIFTTSMRCFFVLPRTCFLPIRVVDNSDNENVSFTDISHSRYALLCVKWEMACRMSGRSEERR